MRFSFYTNAFLSLFSERRVREIEASPDETSMVTSILLNQNYYRLQHNMFNIFYSCTVIWFSNKKWSVQVLRLHIFIAFSTLHLLPCVITRQVTSVTNLPPPTIHILRKSFL